MSKISIPPELERRTEDYALITGRAHYVDDLRPPTGRPPALHLGVVRSPYAHATIKGINLDAARALPGVAAAFAGAELVSGMPPFDSFPVAGLLPETSCERGNKYLDRSVLVPTMDRADLAFFET